MAKNLTNSNNIQINESGNDINLDFTNETQELIDKITPNETKLNGIVGKILWQNPNPTSTFSSQTIILSSSDWDAYEVIYSYAASAGSNTMSSGIVPKGRNAGCVSVGLANNYPLVTYRQIAYVNQSSMTIGYDAHSSHSYGGTSTGTEYCIPLYIIGYKTGLFN